MRSERRQRWKGEGRCKEKENREVCRVLPFNSSYKGSDNAGG
jgi:hypothetical protein